MSKGQKLSFFPLEDLPNEILLKILSLLDIKEVLQCGQSSTRLRKISNDKSLWLKLNLCGRKVPHGFIEKAMQNGCEYLKLRNGCVVVGKEHKEEGQCAQKWGRMLVFVIYGFIKNFSTNSYFILHVHLVKGFKMRHYRYLYFNFSVRYS